MGLISHPVAPFACGPGWVAGPQAGWVISMAAALTLQEVLLEVGRKITMAEPTGTSIPLSSMPPPTLMAPVPKPWIPGLCAHRRGKTCSGGSTRCHDVGAGAARPLPDRTDGKGHSRLGRTPAGGGESEQWAQCEARRPRDETL